MKYSISTQGSTNLTVRHRKSSKPKEQKPDLWKLLNFPILLALTTAWLYTAGWAFARYQFDFFNMGMIGLDISKEYFFQYGFWAVLDSWYWVILFFVVLWGALIAYKWFQKEEWPWGLQTVVVPAGVIFLIFTFFSASWLGESSAKSRLNTQKKKDFPDYHQVRVVLQKDKKDEFQRVMKVDPDSLETGCYRHLIQNKQYLYIFQNRKQIPTAKFPVIAIPHKIIESFQILPKRTSC